MPQFVRWRKFLFDQSLILKHSSEVVILKSNYLSNFKPKKSCSVMKSREWNHFGHKES